MLLDDLTIASRLRKIETDTFFYTAVFNPLAADATQVINIPINANSDFVIRYVNITAFDDAVPPVNIPEPNILLQITDTGTGRFLQDAAMHVMNVMGSGQLPFVWPEPKLIPANSTIAITLTDLSGADQRVDVALCGIAVFYYQGFSRDLLRRV